MMGGKHRFVIFSNTCICAYKERYITSAQHKYSTGIRQNIISEGVLLGGINIRGY